MGVGCKFVCDRVDIENCEVNFPTAGKHWQKSIENMSPVDSGRYIAVFANYVFEHVENLQGAAQEIYRVLVPGGLFVATVSNPSAPEFIFAKHTSLWFHKLIRKRRGWETKYAYDDISGLLKYFLDAGLQAEDEKYWPFVEGYLSSYPVIGGIGRLYDKTIAVCQCRRFMGNVGFALMKPE
jgi:SAM-dependent methyltransferase